MEKILIANCLGYKTWRDLLESARRNIVLCKVKINQTLLTER